MHLSYGKKTHQSLQSHAIHLVYLGRLNSLPAPSENNREVLNNRREVNTLGEIIVFVIILSIIVGSSGFVTFIVYKHYHEKKERERQETLKALRIWEKERADKLRKRKKLMRQVKKRNNKRRSK